jgi:CPA1 family monovalent cation:H+ antiporter
VAVAIVTVGRAVAVYPLCALFFKSRFAVTYQHQNILFWGGLRGALALALALSLPYGMPNHDAIVTVTFAVVAFSVFMQGLTIPLLLQSFARPRPARLAHHREVNRMANFVTRSNPAQNI